MAAFEKRICSITY